MPVAVELNGLLPGRGPGRGAPGRGAPGRGAPGRGALAPGAPAPAGRGAAGRAPAPPWGRSWARWAPAASEGRGAWGRAAPGPRKSAGVAGDRGGPGTPGVPGDLDSPGRDAGDGGTGGSWRAASAATASSDPAGVAAPAASGAVACSATGVWAAGVGQASERPFPFRGATPSPGRAAVAVPLRPEGRGRGWPSWDEARGPLLAFWSCAAGAAKASLSRRTTGASIVEEADRTNSPISLSWSITALLSTPNSFASS